MLLRGLPKKVAKTPAVDSCYNVSASTCKSQLTKADLKQNGELLLAGTDVPKNGNGMSLCRQQSAADMPIIHFKAKLAGPEQKTNDAWPYR